MSRWPRTSPLVVDIVLAIVFTAATTVELVLAGDRVSEPLAVQFVAFWMMTGSIAVRRVQPLAASVTCAAGMATQTLAGPAPVAGGFLALLLVTVSLGWYETRRWGPVGLLAILFGALLYDFLAEELILADLVVNAVIVTAAWGSARVLRHATDRRIATEIGADRLARDAVTRERGRIARDLHDSLAHALTLMTLQAGGARERSDEEVARSALGVIEDTGREALADMNRFLSLLGEDPREAPGIADLPALVERVAHDDLSITLSALPGDLPASLSTTAFRIVQEALTNVVRHSTARSARVDLRRDGGSLLVRVTDDGEPVAARTAGTGRGLAGLTERVRHFDGTLDVGPADPGWQLEARLPLARP